MSGFDRGRSSHNQSTFSEGVEEGVNRSIAFLEENQLGVSAVSLRRGMQSIVMGTEVPDLAVGNRPTRIEREAPVPAAEFEPGPRKMTREEARGKGFTGNTCSHCGSTEMQIAGHCEVCSACGTTTGCS